MLDDDGAQEAGQQPVRERQAAEQCLPALCTHPDAMHLRTPRELGRAAAVLHGARTYGA